MKTKTFLSLSLLAAAVFIGIDQLLKHWAVQVLQPVQTIRLWSGVLHLEYRENRGAAFSILQNRTFLLIGVTSVVLFLLLGLLLSGRVCSRLFTVSLSLILAGGFGNLIDRVFRGYVVDYIYFVPINFPVFNFADCCVVIGTGLMLLYFLVVEPRRESGAAADG